MNKAELKKICFKWLWKAFEIGTKQDPFSANNSEYWHPAIDLDWSERMMEEIKQYAEQENQGMMKTGIKLIAEERQEQIIKHGRTANHDDQHNRGELRKVAAILAVNGTDAEVTDLDGWNSGEDVWELEERLSGDENIIHRLKVAGALIAAEIDRLLRLKEQGKGER